MTISGPHVSDKTFGNGYNRELSGKENPLVIGAGLDGFGDDQSLTQGVLNLLEGFEILLGKYLVPKVFPKMFRRKALLPWTSTGACTSPGL
jgi:hypothetical protein